MSVTAFRGKHISVPCGKCLGCLQRRRADWTQRIEYEERHCKISAFITLTYDDFSIPLTENGNLTLSKKHLQDYFKRVRTKDMKFFACGEYGKHTFRPHSHACVFDVPLEKLNDKWSHYGDSFGFVKFGKVEDASIHYITKYIVNEDNKNWYDSHDELKPFQLMSKGLGKGLADDYRNYCNYYQSNIVTRIGGNKSVLPRYIDEKIFSRASKWTIAEKAIEAAKSAKEIPFELVVMDHNYKLLLASKTSKSTKC